MLGRFSYESYITECIGDQGFRSGKSGTRSIPNLLCPKLSLYIYVDINSGMIHKIPHTYQVLLNSSLLVVKSKSTRIQKLRSYVSPHVNFYMLTCDQIDTTQTCLTDNNIDYENTSIIVNFQRESFCLS